MMRPPWYGGNKIPDSYLKRFTIPSNAETDGLPDDLRGFLNQLGAHHAPGPRQTDTDD